MVFRLDPSQKFFYMLVKKNHEKFHFRQVGSDWPQIWLGCQGLHEKLIQTNFEVNVTFGIFHGLLILLILAQKLKNHQKNHWPWSSLETITTLKMLRFLQNWAQNDHLVKPHLVCLKKFSIKAQIFSKNWGFPSKKISKMVRAKKNYQKKLLVLKSWLSKVVSVFWSSWNCQNPP